MPSKSWPRSHLALAGAAKKEAAISSVFLYVFPWPVHGATGAAAGIPRSAQHRTPGPSAQPDRLTLDSKGLDRLLNAIGLTTELLTTRGSWSKSVWAEVTHPGPPCSASSGPNNRSKGQASARLKPLHSPLRSSGPLLCQESQGRLPLAEHGPGHLRGGADSLGSPPRPMDRHDRRGPELLLGPLLWAP